jgi:murein DD-endopeptidase MepM/ murein hydrolase activator NlpD
MASSLVELDDLVDVGEKIGTKGNESFHFELRKGREHLDPVIWLDIDAI